MLLLSLDLQFFAKHGGGGSASTNCSHKSYNPNNLGVKKFGGEYVKGGNIIVRQRGSKFLLGKGVYFGKDYTVHARGEGVVRYYTGRKRKKYVEILPLLES